MHNLIIDKIKLNNNINDHFEDLRRREHHMFEESERNTNNDFFGNFNNEKSLEKKNKDLDKQLVYLYRLHSSKFHKQKNIKLKDDLINMRLNLLQKSEIEKSNSINNNSKNNMRKKLAFKFRFINKICNVNNLELKNKKRINYKKKNEKMNKILKISKSLSDVLYDEIKAITNKEKNTASSISESSKQNNEPAVNYSLKSQRCSSNIYNYYKPSKPLFINNNMFNIRNKIKIIPLNKEDENKNILSSIPKKKIIKNSNDTNLISKKDETYTNDNIKKRINRIKLKKLLINN